MDKIEISIVGGVACGIVLIVWLIVWSANVRSTGYAAACEASGGKAVSNGRFDECLYPR
jgi:hypothetical protein